MRKTNLKKSKNLTAKTQLKKKRLKNKPKPGSVSFLKKIADDIFSTYVVYRDGEYRVDGWYSQCVTCEKWIKLVYKKDGTIDRRAIHWGHFQSSRHNITRYDERNVNAQCYVCNVHNQGEQFRYSQVIDVKWGEGTAKELQGIAKQEHPFTVQELEEIISDAQKRVDYMLEHATM